MEKMDKNSVIGIATLLVFAIFGFVGISGGVLMYVLYGSLHLILAAVTYLGVTFAIEGRGGENGKGRFFWCDLAPFAVILTVATLVAGWDFYIMFYFLGMVYLTLNESYHRLNVVGLTFKDVELYKPIAAGLGSAILYALISFAGGAPV